METESKNKPQITSKRIQDIEEELRQFDLDYKYGPCIDLTRKQRWERAEKFGLNPPQSLFKYLDNNETSVLAEALQ